MNKGLGTSTKTIEMGETDTCKSLGDKECVGFFFVGDRVVVTSACYIYWQRKESAKRPALGKSSKELWTLWVVLLEETNRLGSSVTAGRKWTGPNDEEFIEPLPVKQDDIKNFGEFWWPSSWSLSDSLKIIRLKIEPKNRSNFNLMKSSLSIQRLLNPRGTLSINAY